MIPQEKWADIINECAYSVPAVSVIYGINESQLRRYLKLEVQPRASNLNKIQKIMEEVMKEPKMQKHPSFGYATEEQIEALKTLGIGPERDRVLKQVEEQSKKKGKIK